MSEQTRRDALADAIECSGSLPAHASDQVNAWNARGIADALLPLIATWEAEAWDECVQEVHSLGWLHDFARSDAFGRNPYRNTGEAER